MKKHEPGSIYSKFLWTTAIMMFICVVIIGILMVGIDASMDTIGIVMGVMLDLWAIMEASLFVYGIFDIKRSNKRQ